MSPILRSSLLLPGHIGRATSHLVLLLSRDMGLVLANEAVSMWHEGRSDFSVGYSCPSTERVEVVEAVTLEPQDYCGYMEELHC